MAEREIVEVRRGLWLDATDVIAIQGKYAVTGATPTGGTVQIYCRGGGATPMFNVETGEDPIQVAEEMAFMLFHTGAHSMAQVTARIRRELMTPRPSERSDDVGMG